MRDVGEYVAAAMVEPDQELRRKLMRVWLDHGHRLSPGDMQFIRENVVVRTVEFTEDQKTQANEIGRKHVVNW